MQTVTLKLQRMTAVSALSDSAVRSIRSTRIFSRRREDQLYARECAARSRELIAAFCGIWSRDLVLDQLRMSIKCAKAKDQWKI